MSKRIRSMIDEIFSEMKMTAENLALRDELMANALARYEDAVAQGRSGEEAFEEVASSLEDVQGLLEEMNRMDNLPPVKEEPETVPELKTGMEKEEEGGAEEEKRPEAQSDLGEALGKAFSALGDFSQAIMPEAKKLAKEMDGVTGGMLGRLGRAAKKGVRDAQKAAGHALDRLGKDQGEIVLDFGPKTKAQEGGEEAAQGDCVSEAAQEDRAKPEEAPQDEAEVTLGEPIILEDGEIDQERLAKAVEDVTREAEQILEEEAPQESAQEYIVRGADEPVSGRLTFSAAGLHEIDVRLDADDVMILPAQGDQIETFWEARCVEGEPVVTMQAHKLVIRRKNPDVFKTFFSVFDKEGGKITICVPRGYAASYTVHTTSGDVQLRDVDVDDVQVNTTSGCVRLEPDPHVRARRAAVTTVSGHATVSACADDVAVTTVSGDQFISCDALKVDVNVVSGKVHAEGASDEWEISAVSGDVDMLCTVAPTKKVLVSSMHANVRLALPDDIRGFAAEIKGPLGCELVNEFGPNRYGTCALPIRMETMRGRLMITRL